MTKDEALKLALEALESDHPDIQLSARITLRAVLAEPPLPVQPERQPLTDERLDEIHASLFQRPFDPEDILNMRVAARAVEAAHNIGAKP